MKNPFSRSVRFKNDLPILPGAFPVAGHSVLAQDGAAHRHMRTALNPPFLPRGLNA